MLCLVDHDPYGIEILATYKYGSKSWATWNDHLVLPDLKWLGIHAKDYEVGDHGVLDLSGADHKKLSQIKSSNWLRHDDPDESWRQEIETLGARNHKAEIEIVSRRAGGLPQFIDEKIALHDWL